MFWTGVFDLVIAGSSSNTIVKKPPTSKAFWYETFTIKVLIPFLNPYEVHLSKTNQWVRYIIIKALVRVTAYARARQRDVRGDDVPHDESDELHDDFVEAGEEVHHDLAAFPHVADEDAERRAERDDACTHAIGSDQALGQYP